MRTIDRFTKAVPDIRASPARLGRADYYHASIEANRFPTSKEGAGTTSYVTAQNPANAH
jgi:hypothetical protein